MHNGPGALAVASWSAHHIPAGSSVRYALDPRDDDAPIRLVIGDHDEIEIGMATSEAMSIVSALQAAERDVRTRVGDAAEQAGS